MKKMIKIHDIIFELLSLFVIFGDTTSWGKVFLLANIAIIIYFPIYTFFSVKYLIKVYKDKEDCTFRQQWSSIFGMVAMVLLFILSICNVL